jgi:hypothetical protein
VAILDYGGKDDGSEAQRTGWPTAATRHVRWLQRLGYTPLTLEEFQRCQQERRFPPRRSVVITTGGGMDRPGLNGVSTPADGLHYIRTSGDESVIRLLLALQLGGARASGSNRLNG